LTFSHTYLTVSFWRRCFVATSWWVASKWPADERYDCVVASLTPVGL